MAYFEDTLYIASYNRKFVNSVLSKTECKAIVTCISGFVIVTELDDIFMTYTVQLICIQKILEGVEDCSNVIELSNRLSCRNPEQLKSFTKHEMSKATGYL